MLGGSAGNLGGNHFERRRVESEGDDSVVGRWMDVVVLRRVFVVVAVDGVVVVVNGEVDGGCFLTFVGVVGEKGGS